MMEAGLRQDGFDEVEIEVERSEEGITEVDVAYLERRVLAINVKAMEQRSKTLLSPSDH
jgi:hypothetical protein